MNTFLYSSRIPGLFEGKEELMWHFKQWLRMQVVNI